MPVDLQEILVAARELPEADRCRLVGELLETLPVDSPSVVLDEDELLKQLEERAAEGLAGGVAWEELREELQRPR